MPHLAEVSGVLTTEEDIVFRGTKIVQSETMALEEAIAFLKRKLELEEKPMSFDRKFVRWLVG